MLQIPQSVFVKTCLYLEPKNIFATRCISREWNQKTKDETLWKNFIKILHPDAFPFYKDNAECAVKDIANPKADCDIGKSEFFLAVSFDGAQKDSLQWNGKQAKDITFPMKDWYGEMYELTKQGVEPDEMGWCVNFYAKLHVNGTVMHRCVEGGWIEDIDEPEGLSITFPFGKEKEDHAFTFLLPKKSHDKFQVLIGEPSIYSSTVASKPEDSLEKFLFYMVNYKFFKAE